MNQIVDLPSDPKATALIANITQLMDEAEQMLRDSTSHHAEGQIELLRARRDDLQARVVDLFTKTGKTIASGVQRTDRVIRAHPYHSLAIALGTGTLLGMMLTRRNG